jgi:sporulation protein YlmC with PRC-barrel domain
MRPAWIRALLLSLSLISCGVLGQPQQLSPRLDRYVGLEMTGSDGKVLGVVDNFLVTPDGEVKAVLVRTKLLLGVGEGRTAIPWPEVRQMTDGRSLFASMTWTEFYRLPDWKPKSTPEVGLLVR